MARTMEGTLIIAQEGRFQLTDFSGVSHLFMLSPTAAAEADQLTALQRRQARLRVTYTPARNVIGNLAQKIELLD